MEEIIMCCDRCGRIFTQQETTLCVQNLILCTDCATELYQKIFEDSEVDEA